MKETIQQTFLKIMLLGIMCAVSVNSCAKETLKPSWSIIANICTNALLTRHVINSLRTAPTATKGACAMAGLFAGLMLHEERFAGENKELSKGFIGHFIGVPFGWIGKNFLPDHSFIDTLAVFAGGFRCGTSLRAAFEDRAKQAEAGKVEQTLHEKDITTPFTFAHLAGTIPQEVREVTEFIHMSEKFQAIGAHMPKGILLVGPPGTGKTSMARAIAGEVNAAFFAISAAEFIDSYIWVGAKNIRRVFSAARNATLSGNYHKAIIFIDEIDTIGSKRTGRSTDGSTEHRTTLNELLNQLDGFTQDSTIFVIAATNRVEDLDSALTRSGRFDRIVTIGLPDKPSRESILQHYAEKIKTDKPINFAELAEKTAGWNCADLKVLVNEAAIQATRENSLFVTQEHFEKSLLSRSLSRPTASEPTLTVNHLMEKILQLFT